MRSRPGYTLVELLIYISIVSIALIVFMNFMTDVSRNAARDRVTKDVSQNARLILDNITRDVRNATNLTGTTATVLKLNSDAVEYSRDVTNNTVTVKNASGTQAITSNTVKVTALTFTLPASSNELSVLVTVQSSNITIPAATLTTTIIPRQTLYQ